MVESGVQATSQILVAFPVASTTVVARELGNVTLRAADEPGPPMSVHGPIWTPVYHEDLSLGMAIRINPVLSRALVIFHAAMAPI